MKARQPVETKFGMRVYVYCGGRLSVAGGIVGALVAVCDFAPSFLISAMHPGHSHATFTYVVVSFVMQSWSGHVQRRVFMGWNY